MAHDLRRGNAYRFGVLADRAYGKVKEHQQIEHAGADGPLNIVIELNEGDKK